MNDFWVWDIIEFLINFKFNLNDVKNILDGFAKRFGLTPEHFGENLRDNYQRYEVEQEPTEPSEVAKEYLSS